MVQWGPLLLVCLMSTISVPPAFSDNEDEPSRPPGARLTGCPFQCVCSSEATVDCSGVDLSSFPSNVSGNTQHLALENNQLEDIPSEDLSRLTKLRTLSLHNNRLPSRGLPDKAFKLLHKLEYLYLANNKLTVTPSWLPDTLRIADFAGNHLEEIFPLTFGHKPKLRSVYLHNNNLTNAGLPKAMFSGSNMVNILILSNNNLTRVPENLPPLLTQLHLQNNRISKIPKGVFSALEILRELYLQSNSLSNIHSHTFSKMKGMQYLDLSSNNLMKVPEGLPPNIVVLQLGKNHIASISKDSVNRIRNLEYLLLQNNRITASGIHKDAFGKLRKLHTLHIFNNPLGKVPASLPRRINSLMLLHDAIERIDLDDFAATYYLTELNLSYNRLRSERLHRLAFRKLRRLERLDLSGNNLTLIPGGLPPSLQALKIQRNQISQLSAQALLGLKALRELHLAHNKLTIGKIAPGTWREVPSLKLLDLGYNDLSYIPPDLPESLEYVYLQNNRISKITSNSFIFVPNIKVIILRSNRLTSAGIGKESFIGLQYLQVLDVTGNPEYISVLLHSTNRSLSRAGNTSTAGSQRANNRPSRETQRLPTAG
ncbi:podocan-like protein 1 isoform X1 [Scyliorhinus canicula]|uniref:podocan-like protein 1 isoform X1 n=2 Tax=Scyliorhinus canicula TaxID=7830 RepID=UPI0018F7A189|nr:podocan-like protein 1 isoform X1 [Scyliorhinus canicula]XP_038641033.1 podocan-like protein 1 isoform X1 [Scyliorhinus canicula]